MTQEEAIKFAEYAQIMAMDKPDVQEFYKLAEAALRQQNQKNTPLTLEELKGMVTQWVWVVVNYDHDGEPFQTDGWGLVATPAVVAYLDQMLPTAFYGRKFVAYRHKPEEAHP